MNNNLSNSPSLARFWTHQWTSCEVLPAKFTMFDRSVRGYDWLMFSYICFPMYNQTPENDTNARMLFNI